VKVYYKYDGIIEIEGVKVPMSFFNEEKDKEYFSMTDMFPGVYDKGMITDRKLTMIKNKYLESFK